MIWPLGRSVPRGHSGIDPAREELSQSPAWWNSEYERLLHATFEPRPFDPDEHEGHTLIEDHRIGQREVRIICTACPIIYVPRRKE